MADRPRSKSRSKPRTPRASSKSAAANATTSGAAGSPDDLALRALTLHHDVKSHPERREFWSLMSSVGGDAVLKLAEDAMQRGRSSAELEGVLHAAVTDYWPELAPAIARRFEREIERAKSSSPRRSPPARSAHSFSTPTRACALSELAWPAAFGAPNSQPTSSRIAGNAAAPARFRVKP